jgi:2'-5' RNA ligase
MGRLFTSFDEAWRFFRDRAEPLEDFFVLFPDEETFLLGWLLRPDPELVPAVQRAQAAFTHLAWITPQPAHFLHVWLGGVAIAPRRPGADDVAVAVDRARRAWRGTGPFAVRYRRVNCFHTAVVVEVEGDGPRALVARLLEADYWRALPMPGALGGVELRTFLPHVTIAALAGAHDPAPLRDALAAVRDAELGRQRVDQATLCVIPAARTTILDPWEVVGAVRLG